MRTTYESAGGAQREEIGELVVGGVKEVVPVYHPEEARAARLVVQLDAQLLQVRVPQIAGLALRSSSIFAPVRFEWVPSIL